MSYHNHSQSSFNSQSSYLNYGLLVWGNTHHTLLERILLLHKKAIGIICNAPFRAHTDHLFYENNILKIKDLYSFHIGEFMYKYNCDTLPFVFHDMFVKNRTIHKYPTRQSEELHLPLLRTFSAQSTFIYEGPKFWNTLATDLKNSPTLSTFKRRLKFNLLLPYKS